MIQLGEFYRDTVTGFVGVATARYEFINGCVRYQLERLDKEGSVQELVFDEQRLAPAAGKRRRVVPKQTGGSRAKAPRTGVR